MKKVFLLLTTYYLLLTTVYAQNPVIAPEVRIPGKAQASVRRIQKPMTGVLFYRLSDSTMCVRNPDNSVTPLSGDAGTSVWFEINDSVIGWAYNGDTIKIGIYDVPGSPTIDITGTLETIQLRRMTGDSSHVIGVSDGDAFMRANTDGTDFDVILNASDPAGVRIQGKEDSLGNALTIYKGANSPFAGDTAVEFKNNGDVVIAKFAGSAQKYVIADANGVLDTVTTSGTNPWTTFNDSTIAFIANGDTFLIALNSGLSFISGGSLTIGDIVNSENFLFIENNSDGFQFKLTGNTVAQFDQTNTAGQTRFLLYDVDNGTLERVTVGAADSGGAGFKVLRIPN